MGTKVLIDGLPSSFHDEDLRALFSPYGLVLSAQIMTAPGGRSLGAGSVRMATIEEATLAIRGLDRKKLGKDVLQVLLISNQNPN